MRQGSSSTNTRYRDSSDGPEKVNGSDLQHTIAEGSFLHRNGTLDTGFIDRTHSFNEHCSILDLLEALLSCTNPPVVRHALTLLLLD